LQLKELRGELHMSNVKFKKLVPEAVMPTRAHATDAGADLVAVSVNITDSYIEYGTGIAIELPSGHCGLLFPRSSISKMDLSLCNSIGLVDEAYVGEIMLRFNTIKPYGNNVYKVGDKVGQLVVIPLPEVTFEEVEELTSTDRGEGGFGSTGV
jgi:dUTP pyrophosphatase